MQWSKTSTKKRKQVVQQEVRKDVEEEKQAKCRRNAATRYMYEMGRRT